MTKKHLFQNGLALFVCLFLFAGATFAQSQTEVIQFTNGDQWNVPTNVHVTSVTFEAWGGGGAGGYAYSTNSLIRATGGGGGGAYAKTTINNPEAGEVFNITVGQGGHATGSYTENPDIADGGNSVVKRGTVDILKAVGGKTVTGYMNGNGAMGGSSADCIGTVKYSGGNGADACPGAFGAWSTSGGGGGGAGTSANGGNGGTEEVFCIICNYCTQYNVESAGAGGAGNPNGNGGVGKKSRIGSGDGWFNIPGDNGSNYGGGGGGSVSGHVTAGDANGGQGGNGIVIVTYTYITETIDAEDVEEYLCSSNSSTNTNFSFPVNIDVLGYQLNEAHLSVTSTNAETGLTVTSTPYFTYTGGKWYVKGIVRNNTTGTLTLTINAKAKSKNNIDEDEFTVTIHVYAKLNGGQIQKNQYLCYNQEVNQFTNVVSATGGKNGNNPQYQWQVSNNANWGFTDIAGANGENYTPSGNQVSGSHYFRRIVVGDECASLSTPIAAEDVDYEGYYSLYLINPNPMNPGMIQETSPGEICPNEGFSTTLYSHYSGQVPVGAYVRIYWQRKVNDGEWENIPEAEWSTNYNLTLTPDVAPMIPGNVIKYRYQVALMESENMGCERVPSNNEYVITVKEMPDYTDQFEDLTITLWYGACDTNIANLAAPVLTPTPADIAGPACEDGLRLAPGTYTITWTVKPDEDCEIYDTYEQQLTVEFPKCGTLDEPYIVKDSEGNEYNTIRIGCDCWFAENLRTAADNATYYDDDDANENFGKLYDWNAAVGNNNSELETMLGTTYIQGVCPEGWAIPTVAQYTTMMSNVDGVEAIKSDDQETWLPGNAGTNASGFAAMGAGYYEAMQYQRMLGYTYFWTADLNESNNTVAKVMELRCGCDQLTCTEKNKEAKVSVRCVKVEPVPSATDCGTVTIDGVDYETVIIGSQCWTRRNLRTTVAANGTALTFQNHPATSNTEPYYFKYKYRAGSTIVPIPEEDQGYLYNWAAALVACPTGWHLPSDAEWTELEQKFTTAELATTTNYRGDHAGKLAGTDYWKVPTNIVANAPCDYDNPDRNISGFTAVPAGHTSAGSSYGQARYMARFWTSTSYDNDHAWYRQIFYDRSGVNRMNNEILKSYGISVRCVKDSE